MAMKHGVHKQQEGIVAIFSVLIIMGILTLLIIGFSNVVRQAQRRTLNDQLNTQAFYAAESGVNIAREAVEDDPTLNKTDCDPGNGFNQNDYDIDTTYNIGLSCLLIDATPPSIDIDNVPVAGQRDPIVYLVENETNEAMSTLNFDWDSANSADPLPDAATPDLIPAADWGGRVGIMRVDVVPTNFTSPGDTVANGRTFYLYPTSSSSFTYNGLVNPGPANHGRFVMTTCNATGYRCRAVIDLGGSSLSRSYYVRVYSYYNPVRASITARSISGTAVTGFRSGQAQIDSTGRANDVFRRIQVRIKLDAEASYNSGFHEVWALLSGDSICKRLVAGPGTTQVPPEDADEACAIN